MVPPPPSPPLSSPNSQYTQQLLSGVLSQRGPSALPYSEDVKWLIRQHLLSLSDAYPSLQPKTAIFTHNDGRSVNLLQAEGTAPMVYHEVTYNIPIIIWLMESYPRHPPLVFVNPTRDMIIKRHHPFVNPSGVVSIPYLQNWVYPSSNLVELARNLSHFFGRDPPLYSQRRPNPTPTPSPSPSINNSISSIGSMVPGSGAAGGSRPAIPPRMTYPPSPYSSNSAATGGRIIEDPSEVYKRNAVNKLVENLHSDIVGLRKTREAEMEGLFSAQGVLRQREEELGKGFKEMQDEKEGLEQQLQMVLMNTDVLDGWLRENEDKLGKLGGNVDVDQAFEPCDGLSKQMLDCTASDLAIEDVIYALDKALQEGAIPFDQYLRTVRLLSREQFFHRATSSKIRAIQMQAQVASMASRASQYGVQNSLFNLTGRRRRMANAPAFSKMTALKSAEEMSLNGDEPPLRYIVKESNFGSIESSVPSAPIPTIDIGRLSSPPPASHEELEKLRSALTSWGCFQATGHGIPDLYLDKVRNVARHFFELPAEQKHKYCRRSDHDGEGYGGDVIVSEKQILDWSDRLALKVLPEDKRRLELWPETPNDFREILHDYAMKIKSIINLLFKAIAKLLNLEDDTFLKQFGERELLIARFNFYPPCPKPNQVLGLKPHSDKSGITVLLQSTDVEGLHVLKDNQWFKVPVIPHAFVVNVGDQMQIMTNGIIKSPVHRAVTNPEKLRMSISISNEAEDDKEIGPAEGLIYEGRPRLYRIVKNYAAINFECFQRGEVALETVKLNLQ